MQISQIHLANATEFISGANEHGAGKSVAPDLRAGKGVPEADRMSNPASHSASQRPVGIEIRQKNIGRGAFDRQVAQAEKTIISRNRSISDANRDKNLQQALARVRKLFGEKSPEQEFTAHAAASRKISDYIERSAPSVELPDDVRNLMIEFQKATTDLPEGYPYGRGNVLRRKQEHGEEVVDQQRTFGKERLMLLAEDIYPEIAAKRNERMLQLSAKISALGVLTGSGSCSNYAHTLALLAAFRINKLPAFKGKVRFDICNMPYRNERRVDHVYGVASYKAEDGNVYKIFLDPSSTDEPQVRIPRPGDFENPITTYNADYFDKVDETTRDLIEAHMTVASNNYLQAVHQSAEHEKKINDAENPLLKNYRADEHYDLNNPLAGRIDARPNNETLEVPAADSRRMSPFDPTESPLLRDD